MRIYGWMWCIKKIFEIDKIGIIRHINNIYKDNELDENRTSSILEHMGNGGKELICMIY